MQYLHGEDVMEMSAAGSNLKQRIDFGLRLCLPDRE